jgi:SAM-dependent methyltransferase
MRQSLAGHERVGTPEEQITAVYSGYANDPAYRARHSGKSLGARAIVHEYRALLRRELTRSGLMPLAGRRVIALGCGGGGELALFREWGAQPADLFGIDLVEERVGKARRVCPGATIWHGSAACVPANGGDFDLVSLMTVMSSIPDPLLSRRVAAEAARLLRPGGCVLWYDLARGNPKNPHVHGTSRAALARLFPGFSLAVTPCTLLPPLARRLGRATNALYGPLSRLPLLRTHLAGVLVAPSL